jgi:hypothetical protein
VIYLIFYEALHMKLPAVVSVVLVLALTLVLGGCSARQSILLREDGTGEAEIRIELDPVFSAYLIDLTATFGEGASENSEVFDLEIIRESFAREPGLLLVEVSSREPEELRVVVEFESLAALFAARSAALERSFHFETVGADRRLVARVDRRTVENLVNLVGIDPFVTESLLPPEGDMTAAEYREYLVWALEEYQDHRPIASVIEGSEIRTSVSPAGAVRQVRGGMDTGSGQAVLFRTPLLEVLTTRTPFEYTLVFRP